MTKRVRCGCGAELRSADGRGLIAQAQAHAVGAHDPTLTDDQVREMIELGP